MKKDTHLGLTLHFRADESRRQTAPTLVEKSLLCLVLKGLGSPNIQVDLWDGETVYPEAGTMPTASAKSAPVMLLKDRAALWRLLVHPMMNFGDDYSAGRIEIQSGLLTFLDRIYDAVEQRPKTTIILQTLVNLYRRFRGNPISRARDNIYHHYDIGNEFYRLWLDKEMAYTCAYFAPEVTTLEQAQLAKMEHVCRKLRLKPGETVIEAGCGWGSLALYMARQYGVKVRAYNISREQISYARERARVEGMEDRVEYIEDDYRHIDGKCDAFVSVGMLEHVGVKHFRELGDLIDRVLSPEGRGLIHTIGQNQPIPTNAWVYRRIFPGGYTPTLRQMMNIFEPYDFSIQDVENLRLHYARTLEHWLQRFDDHLEEVRAMTDDAFIRAWHLYLCGSIANFSGGYLQLYQVLFSRPKNCTLPLTRDDLYH